MSRFRHPLLLFVLALCFFAIGTGSLPLIDRDEPRFAEASREMRENGDYVVPRFNHGYRFDKPPLIYWAQAASYAVLGETDFAARFPSIAAAALTVLLVYGFGTRMDGRETGWKAALIFLTALQVSLHAKGAVADMAMVLFFTLAAWAGWEHRRAGLPWSARWGWWSLFYSSLALGFLAKGPVALLPLAAVGLDSLWSRRCGEAPPPAPEAAARLALGIALMLSLVALWGVPALLRTDGEFLKVGLGKHVIERSISAMEGHGSRGWGGYLAMLPLYFGTVFVSFFPWSLRIPALLRRLREAGISGDARRRYLLLGIAFVFGVFTLVRTKLPHYILPALPLLALLLAREWDALPSRRVRMVERWAAAALAGLALFFLIACPLLAPLFPARTLIAKSAAALTPEMEFASTGYQEPSLVWYARQHVRGWYTPLAPRKLAAFMAQPGPRFCVAPAGTLLPAPEWQVFTAQGFNLVHFRKVDLQLMVKPR